MIDLTQTPPHSIEIERRVLGVLISFDDSYSEIADVLTYKSFYKMEHQLVFKAIEALHNAGKQYDTIHLTERMMRDKTIKEIGGPAFLAGLADGSLPRYALEEDAMLIKEKELKRNQISLGLQLVQRGYDAAADPLEAMDWAADEVYKMASMSELGTEETNQQVAKEIMQEIGQAIKSEGIVGLKSGFHQQDEVLGGYQAPNLVIWAARPGMGKTAKMLCEAYYIAVALDTPVLIFSMEMSRKELFKRLAVIHAKVGSDIYRPKGKKVNHDKLGYFEQKLFQLAEKNIIIDDTPAITLAQMRNRAKKEVVKNGIKIIFADYLQLMSGVGQNREAQISYCSRGSKALAKELNVPIIMLSQLSRETTRRSNKEPQLSDLRESGAIEQDADIVGFVHRPPYYDENADDKEEAYFIIAKHRNGALARIASKYVHDRTEFLNPGDTVAVPFAEEKDEDDNLPF